MAAIFTNRSVCRQSRAAWRRRGSLYRRKPYTVSHHNSECRCHIFAGLRLRIPILLHELKLRSKGVSGMFRSVLLMLGMGICACAQGADDGLLRAQWSVSGHDFANSRSQPAEVRIGPANVQGFVTDDGAVVIHEVNPRFSGGLPLSLAAGADLVEEYLRAIMGASVRPERLVGRPGVLMLRHFCEVFEG